VSPPLLAVRQLKTHFFTADGVVRAVDGVDLTIAPGQTVGLVGESGCGKSVTALSIMRLVPPPGRIVGGEIWLNGRDLLTLPERDLPRIRGKEIAMIFQEPMTALNPVFTIGEQIAETILAHENVSRAEARDRAIAMLRTVGLPHPEQRYAAYPHELSGGMRQRAMIAIALACGPQLLIADEPTTALDVTIQAQILELLKALQAERRMALLLITHDLGVIAEMAEEVAVMYAGQIVEQADVLSLFRAPKHPYTQGLLRSLPTLETPRHQRLAIIPGTVPTMRRLPAGCRFAPRCPQAMPVCHTTPPDLGRLADGRWVRCHLYPASPASPATTGPAPAT